jgi:hypothetical protein
MNNLIALIDNAVGSKSKCESLVYIHAYLSGASHVPRVFVPDEIRREEAEGLLETLLLSHPLQIAQKTHSRAKSYISGYIYDINSKNTILQDIEAVVESSFGSGKIVYEESRFTPYGRSLYDDSIHLITIGSPKISSHILNKREKARKRAPHQTRHGTPCTPVERALRTSYEQKWALAWMTPSMYLVPGDSTKTVHTIWANRFGDA